MYVRFSGGVDDYFETYAIRGSCDHIASLSYYKDGTDGVIALELDQVFELEDSYEPGRLYLEFLGPMVVRTCTRSCPAWHFRKKH